MDSVNGLILALFLIICGFSAGCTSENTPSPGSVNIPEPGVLIQNFGDVTGQGVILQGVPRGTIDTLTFTIGLAPGIRTIDLNNMTIVYTDAVRTDTFVPVAGYRGNPPPGYWGIIDTLNEAGAPNMRLDYEERIVVRINPRAAIVPNQVITISVKPTEGKPLVFRRVTPSPIAERENVLQVL